MTTPCRILTVTCALALSPGAALAATYTVGPPGSGAQYAQLADVFEQRNLAPGDIVSVRGGASYGGGIVVDEDDGGAAGNPVTIRWDRAGGSRPRLQGGAHTIKFAQSHHVVFEGFEVSGGSSTCVFYEANDITVRDAVIHACPAHGILGADRNSGSFTLEYSEIFDAGEGTNKHPMYIQSDEVAFPQAVFRMRYNYIHGGNGGNLLKSRHQRSEIHYNWFEGGAYQELELIGPDCETQQPGWDADLVREDADVVGNVIVHTGSWNNVIRAGGDLNGRSQGRVRLVNNTILIDRAAGGARVVYVQLGLESLEMHGNAIFHTGGAAPAIVGENTDADTPFCGPQGTQPWTAGRKVHGTHNWVETAATLVPGEWGVTHRGADPGFASIAQRNLRPVAGSPLLDNGIDAPPAPPTFPFPSPLQVPVFDPPLRSKLAINGQRPRHVVGGTIDVGALEIAGGSSEPIPLNGSQPLIPPADFPAATVRGATPLSGASASVRAARARHAALMPRNRGAAIAAPSLVLARPVAAGNAARLRLLPQPVVEGIARTLRSAGNPVARPGMRPVGTAKNASPSLPPARMHAEAIRHAQGFDAGFTGRCLRP
jgi:hypothetical protein